jgi:hypothetical protein
MKLNLLKVRPKLNQAKPKTRKITATYNMKTQIVTAIAIGITGSFPVMAAPTQQPNIPIESLFELTKSDVVNQKFENGRLVFCNVVGISVIRTSLGEAMGLQIAGEKSGNNAKEAFVAWTKTNVTSITSQGDEAIVTVKGQGDESGVSTSEESKGEDRFKKEVALKAQGLVRGLSLVGSKQIGNKMVTVYKWSSKAFNAATNLEADSKASESGVTMPTSASGVKRKAGVDEKTVVLPGWDQP